MKKHNPTKDDKFIFRLFSVKNNRKTTLLFIILGLTVILSIYVLSGFISEDGLATNFDRVNYPPSFRSVFGTDWLGRDMFTRTIKGLRLSIITGVLTTLFSLTIGVVLALVSSINYFFDKFVLWLINVFLTIPATILSILISILMGKGAWGVIIAVSITHWPVFTKIIRSKVIEINDSLYVKLSKTFGKGTLWIAFNHIFPHIIPMLFVGVTVTFPSAILHEATLTLLGFGLSPHEPAIGIILSESINYLSTGHWWLFLFPGLSLLILVMIIQITGERLRYLIDPTSRNE